MTKLVSFINEFKIKLEKITIGRKHLIFTYVFFQCTQAKMHYFYAKESDGNSLRQQNEREIGLLFLILHYEGTNSFLHNCNYWKVLY